MCTSISPPSQNNVSLHTLIHSDPLILNYFRRADPSLQTSCLLARQLILDGIRYRTINQKNSLPTNQPIPSMYAQINNGQNKDKNYQMNSESNYYGPLQKRLEAFGQNTALAKINRFLSPKSKGKNSLTPKITETMPMLSSSLIIYGKPKVKTDEGYGCPCHDFQCPESTTPGPVLIKQIHIEEHQKRENEIKEGVKHEWQKQFEKFSRKRDHFQNTKEQCLSPYHLNTEMSKTVKYPKINMQELSDCSSDDYLSTKNINSQKKKEPQSRIKQLIDRDKKNRALHKKLRAQEKRLDKMEAVFSRINKNSSSNKQIGSKLLSSNEQIDYELSNSSLSGGHFESVDLGILERIKEKEEGKMRERGAERVEERNDESSFEFD